MEPGRDPAAGMRNLTSRRARRVHLSVTRPGNPRVRLENRRNGETAGVRHQPGTHRPPPFNRPREKKRRPLERRATDSRICHRTAARHGEVSRTRHGNDRGARILAVLSFRCYGYEAMSTGHPCARDRREKPPRKCRVGKMVSNHKVQGGRQQGAEGFPTRRRGMLKALIVCLPVPLNVGSTIFPPITNTAGAQPAVEV